jgi:SAM-dependent methyltransferase
MVTETKWDTEYARGKWDYLDAMPVERARNAIIGMYCQHYARKGGILDVGRGLATTVDFLNSLQRRSYLGIDISEEALRRSDKNVSLVKADFMDFQAPGKFDLIVFNEVLYYLDVDAALLKAFSLLRDNGKIIISIYKKGLWDKKMRVWQKCHRLLRSLDALSLSGNVNGRSITWRIGVFEEAL